MGLHALSTGSHPCAVLTSTADFVRVENCENRSSCRVVTTSCRLVTGRMRALAASSSTWESTRGQNWTTSSSMTASARCEWACSTVADGWIGHKCVTRARGV